MSIFKNTTTTIAVTVTATCLLASTAVAQQVSILDDEIQAIVNATIETHLTPSLEDENVLELSAMSIVQAVCIAGFNLSENAQNACDDVEAIPSLIADGSRLSNRGVGAEFNTLWRQITSED